MRLDVQETYRHPLEAAGRIAWRVRGIECSGGVVDTRFSDVCGTHPVSGSAVLDEVEHETVELRGVFDHRPVTAAVQQHQA